MKIKYILLLLSFLTINASHAQVNLGFGLIAQYDFTDQSLDDSGPNFLNLINNNNVTPTADRFGNLDYAYQFDGVDDYLSTSNNSLLTLGFGATISLWVNLNDVTAKQVLIGNLSAPPVGSDGGYMISVENGQFIVETWVGNVPPTTQYTLTAGNIQPNQWTHVSVTFMSAQPNNKLVLYQDGQAMDSTFVSDALGSNANDLVIGAPAWDQTLSLTNGKIDDIKIYNRKVNASEISAIFNEVVTSIDNQNSSKLNYFNNFNGSFTFNASSNQKINEINIVDASGRIISTQKPSNSQSEIVNLSSRAKGIYFVIVNTNLGFETFKLIH